MKWQLIFLLLMGMMYPSPVYPTCVFESDFGFTFNCAFKKSSIFRIRNLGGVKGYFGLGLSVGDELGFKESLSNVESSNRRSVDSGRSASGYFQQLLTTTPRTERQISPESSPNNISRSGNGRSHQSINIRAPGSKFSSVPLVPVTVPPFKPIHPAVDGSKLSRPVRLSSKDDEKIGGGAIPPTLIAVPAFAALPDSITKLSSSSSNTKRITQNAFQNMLQNANRRFSITSFNGQNEVEQSNSITQPQLPSTKSTNTHHHLTTSDPFLPDTVQHVLRNVIQNSNISADALLASIQLRQQQLLMQQRKQLAALITSTSFNPSDTTSATTTTSTTTTTTTTTTTPPPTTTVTTTVGLSSAKQQKYTLASSGVNTVMNAPKEYYPVSYDKNFDDNFTSKVELPDTSFSCGDQKHFPGLYADEDLNCMVFHVCALTDDGLVMKSFLCPESTLFDQTILKCNWWFYVDCKASKKLYDSNIPISKSYQLMKALAFFSSYSKNEQSQQAQQNLAIT